MDKNKYYLIAVLLAAVGVGVFLLWNGSDEPPITAPGEVPALAQEDPNEPTTEVEVGVYGAEKEEPLDEPLEEPVKEGTATAESVDKEPGIQILPVGNQDVVELTAKDVVQVLRAAGFSDTQIYEHGPAVRDAMAGSGAVPVKIDGKVEAVFAARGDLVYVSTRSKGHFTYNVQTGEQNFTGR